MKRVVVIESPRVISAILNHVAYRRSLASHVPHVLRLSATMM